MIAVTPQAAAQILQSAGGERPGLRRAARRGDKGGVEYGMGLDARAQGGKQVE
jgi:hypothetical protein